MIYEVTVGGRTLTVSVARAKGGGYTVAVDGGAERHVGAERLGAAEWLLREDGRARTIGLALERGSGWAQVDGSGVPVEVVDPRDDALDLGGAGAQGDVVSPIPGAVARVLVQPGQAVQAGRVVVVVEAMKMENEFKAPCDGVVELVAVEAGQSVDAGALLVKIAPAEEA